MKRSMFLSTTYCIHNPRYTDNYRSTNSVYTRRIAPQSLSSAME